MRKFAATIEGEELGVFYAEDTSDALEQVLDDQEARADRSGQDTSFAHHPDEVAINDVSIRIEWDGCPVIYVEEVEA